MSKSNVSASLNRAFQEMAGQIVREAIAKLPRSMTMGEVYREFADSNYAEIFNGMSITQFGAAIGAAGQTASASASAPSRRGPGRPKGSSGAGRKAAKSGGKTWNTRTEQGRAALDAEVTKVLQAQKTLGAEQLREAVGGKPPQLRESLKRLMDAGQVKKTGQKRATQYHWKG